MKTKTLKKLQNDSTLSEIQIMACGALIETKKGNGHTDTGMAAANLRQHYPSITISDSREYVEMVANMANDMEWNG